MGYNLTQQGMHISKSCCIVVVAILISSILLLPLLWFYNKPVHISIDDVGASLEDLHRNGNEYKTMFHQPFFHSLEVLHDITGVKITLYAYAQYGDYEIENIQERFISEIRQNSDWLQLSFHSSYPALPVCSDKRLKLLSAFTGKIGGGEKIKIRILSCHSRGN